MNEHEWERRNPIDDLHDCPDCHGDDPNCSTCSGTGDVDRFMLEDLRQDYLANAESWKDR